MGWTITEDFERLESEAALARGAQAVAEARLAALTKRESAVRAERWQLLREVERLRAEATGEAARAMMLEVDLDNARAEVERLRSENERLRAAGEVMWDAAMDKVPDSSRLERAAECWSYAADRERVS